MAPSKKTAALCYTMPLWVLVFAGLALHERLGRWRFLAVVTSLVCLLILIQPWNLTGGLAASVLATCAGMFWAVSVVYLKNMQKKTSISMLMIALWQMIFGTLVLALGWLCFEAAPINWTAPLIGAILRNGILGIGLAWMLFCYALRRMPAGMAGLGTLESPIVGGLAAWLQLGEYPTPVEATGMSLIGIALAMLAGPPPSSGSASTA